MTTKFLYKDGIIPDFNNPRHGLHKIVHNYGPRGLSGKNNDTQNCNKTICLVFKDGKTFVYADWEYDFSMCSTEIFAGEIMYDDWSLEEIIERMKGFAEKIAPSITEEDEESEIEITYFFNKDGEVKHGKKKEKKETAFEAFEKLPQEEQDKIIKNLKAVFGKKW